MDSASSATWEFGVVPDLNENVRFIFIRGEVGMMITDWGGGHRFESPIPLRPTDLVFVVSDNGTIDKGSWVVEVNEAMVETKVGGLVEVVLEGQEQFPFTFSPALAFEEMAKAVGLESSPSDLEVEPIVLDEAEAEAFERFIRKQDSSVRNALRKKREVFVSKLADENLPLQLGATRRLRWEKRLGYRDVVFLIEGEGVIRAVGQVVSLGEHFSGTYSPSVRVIAQWEKPLHLEELLSHRESEKWTEERMGMEWSEGQGNFLEHEAAWGVFRRLLNERASDLGPLFEYIEPKPIGSNVDLRNQLIEQLPGYSSDMPLQGEDADLLNLKAEYRSLAMLLAAKPVAPPLAIGLFGEWGSGKSFYIQQVKREVEQIAELAKDASQANDGEPDESKSISYHKDIYQIEFNAWHYSEGDLWASLVDHLFTSLREQMRERAGVGQEALADEKLNALLEKLETSKKAETKAKALEQELETQIRTAKGLCKSERKKLIDATEKRESCVGEDPWKSLDNNSVKDVPWKEIESSPLNPLANAKDDVRGVYELGCRLRGIGGSSRVIWRSLRSKGLKAWGVGLFVGVLMATLSIGLLLPLVIGEPGESVDVTATLAQLGVFVSGIWFWVKRRLDSLGPAVEEANGYLDAMELAIVTIESALASEEQKKKDRIQKLDVEIALAGVRLEEAQRSRAQAERQKMELLAQIAEELPENRLAQFIEDRANASDYRDKLGVMALVRRDFESLSNLMVNCSEKSETQKRAEADAGLKKGELPSIERIVLYIDDLDRCSPQKVSEVLQAVHLLLAYRLFIVLVAVDSRWVSKSLELTHPNLLKGEVNTEEAGEGGGSRLDSQAHATSVDYLEKIFQIPYCLPRFSATGARRLVHGLLIDETVIPQKEEEGLSEKQREEERAFSKFVPPAKNDKGISRAVSASSRPRELESVVVRELPDATDLNPDSLKLGEEELKTLVAVAALAGTTPRQVKRFTNLYRLVKVGLGKRELKEFLGEGEGEQEFSAVSFLLAVATGAPAAQPLVFRIVEEMGTDKPFATLPTAFGKKLKALQVSKSLSSTDILRFHEVHRRLIDYCESNPMNMEVLNKWVPRIRKYSFEG